MAGRRHLLPEYMVGMDLGGVEVTPVTGEYPPKLVKLRMYEAEVQVPSKAPEAAKPAGEVDTDDATTGERPKKMRLH